MDIGIIVCSSYCECFSTFGAKNTPESGPFKTNKIAQTLPKKLENNFELVHNATFSTPKMVKNDPLKSKKLVKNGSKRRKS